MGSAADADIHKTILGSRTHDSRSFDLVTRTLIISSKKMEYIMEIVKFLKDFDLLIKSLVKQLKTKQRNKKGGFLSMLSGTLCPSLLGIFLKSKGERNIRTGENF